MKLQFELNRRTTAKCLLVSFLIALIFFVGFATGVSKTWTIAHKEGYFLALSDIAGRTGIDFEWQDLGRGKYLIEAYYQGSRITKANVGIDLFIEHRRNGELLSADRNAGTLTNGGKDWIEQQISGTSSDNVTKYISCDDTDASGLSAASTQLTSELNANGFTRATGTYTSTGVGAWNVTYTFTSSGTQSVQTYGLQWSPTAVSNNNLIAYDTSAVKNTVSGDTLKVTFQVTVS